LGSWVAISGDYAVVGAPEDFEAAGCTGAAYIFQRKGTAWLRAEKIIASDAADGDLFGMPVAIDGSVVGGLWLS
jgi:FG-GAP repeat